MMETLERTIPLAATIVASVLAVITLWRQQRQAARLRVLEAELNRASFEHQTKFSRLHERRAEVTAEIYRRVVVLEIWLSHVVAETELPDEAFESPEAFAENFDRVFGHISLSLQGLARYFNLNRLYLDETVCRRVLQFHDEILHNADPVYGYFYERFKRMPEADVSEIYGENLRKRAHNVLNRVSDSRQAIEADFRALLGISPGQPPSGRRNDLMWIPAPDSLDPITWPPGNHSEKRIESMTQDEIVQAIDGTEIELAGEKWTLNVAKIEPIGTAGQQLCVRFAISGVRNLAGDLVITPSRYDAQEIREMAVAHATDIVTGKMPPGTKELL